jgi:g-D-glutamyl-meso-diaminopimelate peptidase
MRAHIFGRSVCGRNLIAYTFGSGRDSVLFAAAFHAQEWMTSYIALRLMAKLCDMLKLNERWRGKNIREMLCLRRIVIVPLVNPDGVEIALHGTANACEFAQSVEKITGGDLSDWNANARGVDLNHNFDAGWKILQKMERAAGVSGPAPRRYGGPCPASEPETRAIIRLTYKENPRRVFAMHSQGEELFWEYGGSRVPGAKALANALVKESGYMLVENDGLASHGGYKDWFIKKFGRPGFTFEFGLGKNPLPLDSFEETYDKAEQMLLLAALGF